MVGDALQEKRAETVAIELGTTLVQSVCANK